MPTYGTDDPDYAALIASSPLPPHMRQVAVEELAARERAAAACRTERDFETAALLEEDIRLIRLYIAHGQTRPRTPTPGRLPAFLRPSEPSAPKPRSLRP